MKKLIILVALALLFAVPSYATVTDSIYKSIQNCNNSVTAFPFTFGIGATSEVKVTVSTSANVKTVLTETTDYTVSCTNSDCSAGGTVVLIAGSRCGSGSTLTLEMNVPYTQDSDYVEGMPTLYETFEDNVDKLTRLSQQLRGMVNRAPLLPSTSTTTNPTLDNPVAGQYLRWNTAGTGIESTSAVSSSGTYMASGTGATARTVDSKLSDVMAAEDYGATGDGTTDDTTAIQYMITANPTGIWNTHGKTYIVSNITVAGNLKIIGTGTIKHKAAAADHMIEASGSLTLDGVTIDGNKANQTGRYSAVYFTGTKLTAKNSTFQNSVASAIKDADGIELYVDNCKFTGMAEHGGTAGQTSYGIDITQVTTDTHFTITNNRFINTAPTGGNGYNSGGVYVHSAQSNKTRGIIQGNYFEYCGQNVSSNNTAAIDLYQLADYTTVADNIIVTPGWQGIAMSDSGRSTITNNKITDAYYAVGQPAIYVQAYNHSTTLKHDHLVSDNYIDWQYGEGIRIQGASGQLVKGTKVIHNSIYNTTRAIYFYYFDGGTIQDNTIENVGSTLNGAIVIRAGQGTVRVYGNRSYDVDTASHLYIYATQPALDLDIQGNEFDTSTDTNYGVAILAGRNVRYIGNQHLNSPTYSFVLDNVTGKVIVLGNTADTAPQFNSIAGLVQTGNSWQTTGGLQVLSKESYSDIEGDASTTIGLNIPSGARLLGSQLRVDAALATGETWDAAWSGGSSTSIAAAQAVAKNTKVSQFYINNINGATDITSNTTNIAITKNGGGSFTAQGTIRAIAYYEVMNAMADAP